MLVVLGQEGTRLLRVLPSWIDVYFNEEIEADSPCRQNDLVKRIVEVFDISQAREGCIEVEQG